MDRLDRLILDILHLVKSRAHHAQTVGINISRSQDLIDTGLLRIKTLLNSLELLLENKVAQTRLLVEFIHQAVELVEEVLPLFLQVLDLLEFDFVLPFCFLIATLDRFDFCGDDVQLSFDLHMDQLLFLELVLLCLSLVKGLSDVLVGAVMFRVLFLRLLLFVLGCLQLFF